MQNGSSEEEDCKTEAGPQDRGGEEIDGEEDGHCSSQVGEEEITLSKARGLSPRLLYFPSKTISYGRSANRVAARSETSHARPARLTAAPRVRAQMRLPRAFTASLRCVTEARYAYATRSLRAEVPG